MCPFTPDGQAAGKPNSIPVVLGAQLAAARKAEAARIADGNIPASPMGPGMRYNFWTGECDLCDPHLLPLDEKLSEISRRFAASDAVARANLRVSMSMDDFYALLNFTRRSAVFALRDKQLSHIVEGLTCVAIIEQKRVDFRDVLVALGLLYGAANRLGHNPDEIFRSVIAMAESDMAGLLEQFINRSPDKKDLQCMGYMVLEGKTGPGLIRWYFKPYKPTYPMERIAMELANLIKEDKYQPTFGVASDLPRAWLAGIDDKMLAEALRSVVAGAQVDGKLRPGAFPEYRQQQLTLFLVELATESTAGALEALARAKLVRENAFSMLAIRRRRLFCLLVARCFVVGGKSFETSELLVRFAPGMEEILKMCD